MDAEHIVDVPVPQVMEEVLEVVENIPKGISERTMEQTVDVPVPHVELQCLLVKLDFSGPDANDTIDADVSAVAHSAGEARLPGIAGYSDTSESELAKSSVKLCLLGQEHVARPMPLFQQSKRMSVKLGLQGS